jgi:hypothetical protein
LGALKHKGRQEGETTLARAYSLETRKRAERKDFVPGTSGSCL